MPESSSSLLTSHFCSLICEKMKNCKESIRRKEFCWKTKLSVTHYCLWTALHTPFSCRSKFNTLELPLQVCRQTENNKTCQSSCSQLQYLQDAYNSKTNKSIYVLHFGICNIYKKKLWRPFWKLLNQEVFWFEHDFPILRHISTFSHPITIKSYLCLFEYWSYLYLFEYWISGSSFCLGNLLNGT